MPDFTGEALVDSLATLRAAEPLVQGLTNEVTKNDVAQVTLHWGGLPVMADAPGEAPEMAELADGMLLHTSPMTETRIDALYAAGRRATELGVPVVLDPVGVGATPTRREVVERLLSSVEFAAIKGNAGEIRTLAGLDADVRGVESVGEYDDVDAAARDLAARTGAVVVASGVADVVATADTAYGVSGGHELMGEVVGTGCMLGATLATFAAALDDPFRACLHGTLAYAVAGERAADLDHNGPASYHVNFLDSVYGTRAVDPADLDVTDRVEELV